MNYKIPYPHKKILLVGSSGYIGSFLSEKISPFYNLATVDVLKSKCTNTVADGFHLDKDFLNSFDGLIMLAGMSRVADCKANPNDCYRLNTELPLHLRKNLQSDKFFIYASSGSLYNGSDSFPASENFEINKSDNAYDKSKLLLDQRMQLQKKPFVSLRFGTVNGFTTYWRRELIINQMCYDAVSQNKLSLRNGMSWRAILDIEDLGRAILKLLSRIDYSQKIYNLSSFNTQIGLIANRVQKITGCTIIDEKEANQTYSFSMDCSLFTKDHNFEFKSQIDTLIQNIVGQLNEGL